MAEWMAEIVMFLLDQERCPVRVELCQIVNQLCIFAGRAVHFARLEG